MDLGLKNKSAVVTGGSKGIGLGIAMELAREGASVWIASRNLENIERAITQIKKEISDAKVHALPLDMSQTKQLYEILNSFLQNHVLDIFVNNSGGPAPAKTTDVTLSQWEEGFKIVLESVFLTTQLILPGMKKRKWGRILNITSTASKEMIPNLAISSTFRAGLSAWVKNISKETGRDGILINNLLPGPVDTDRIKELEIKSPAFFQSFIQESSLGRLGTLQEIGRIGAFLCSQANGFITGTDIVADGGYLRSF